MVIAAGIEKRVMKSVIHFFFPPENLELGLFETSTHRCWWGEG